MAGEICVLYHEAVKSEVSTITKAGKRHMPSMTLDEVDESARRAFIAAATICLQEDADTREYVVAQFAASRSAGAYHRKFFLPSPQQMGTVNARVRYLQHKADIEVRKSRVARVDDQDDRRRFFVEERTLRGLARVQRRDPVDVLAEQPERFSRAFLEHRGVWGAVRDIWEEKQL